MSITAAFIAQQETFREANSGKTTQLIARTIVHISEYGNHKPEDKNCISGLAAFLEYAPDIYHIGHASMEEQHPVEINRIRDKYAMACTTLKYYTSFMPQIMSVRQDIIQTLEHIEQAIEQLDMLVNIMRRNIVGSIEQTMALLDEESNAKHR